MQHRYLSLHYCFNKRLHRKYLKKQQKRKADNKVLIRALVAIIAAVVVGQYFIALGTDPILVGAIGLAVLGLIAARVLWYILSTVIKGFDKI